MKKFIIIAMILTVSVYAKCYTVCGQDGCETICINDD